MHLHFFFSFFSLSTSTYDNDQLRACEDHFLTCSQATKHTLKGYIHYTITCSSTIDRMALYNKATQTVSMRVTYAVIWRRCIIHFVIKNKFLNNFYVLVTTNQTYVVMLVTIAISSEACLYLLVEVFQWQVTWRWMLRVSCPWQS